MGRQCWHLALVLGLCGCAKGSDESPFSGPGVGPGVSTTNVAGDTTAGSDAAEDSTAGSGGGTASPDGTAGSEGPPPGACQGMMGTKPLGEVCSDACDCASGRCFQVALGSACSECISDVECMAAGASGTCSVDPSTSPPFARCTQGQLGVMCEPGSAGCQAGLVCAQLIDTQGFLPDYFCSECATTADCPGGSLCVPTVEIDGVSAVGYWYCVTPGSVQDGELCPLLPSGLGDGTPCASGRCAVADVAGLGVAEIGVCSSCTQDGDCAAGQTCMDAQVDENGAVPATCA